jgi:hypothetical protein
MIKQGLIIKTADRNNKHLFILELTSKGLSAYNGAIAFLSLHDVFSCLTLNKRRQLYSLLETLRTGSFNVLGLNAEIYSGLFSDELILSKIETNPVQNEDKPSEFSPC